MILTFIIPTGSRLNLIKANIGLHSKVIKGLLQGIHQILQCSQGIHIAGLG